ncbi:RluA family pseudouridine synthase [Candidatus Saccharibacteria bacterium]|nr:RluA family pseudouridine synthase [Candidatus Saccharibacteria bacterium]
MSEKIAYEPGQRLDKALAAAYPQYSRAYLSRLIDADTVLVNGKPTKAGWKLRANDEVTITVDLAQEQVIEDIDLPILYEDDDVLVINKPSGVISHSRGKYWYEPSVASFVRQHAGKQANPEDRSGIVHRLDRATSGVMICAKNERTLSFLQKQFSARTVEKTYIAVVAGTVSPEAAVIDMPIERNPRKPSSFRVGSNGKAAQTAYTTLKQSEKYTELELKPKTGRTHQLRVHLAHLGKPIVGDELYGGESADRLMLHAASLTIELPSGDNRAFRAPVPLEFGQLVKAPHG